MSFNSIIADANTKLYLPCWDAAASTAVVDESGEGNDGVLNGGDNTTDLSVTGPNSYLTGGLDLDGAADYIEVGSAIASGTPTTMWGWFKVAAGEPLSRCMGHYVGTATAVIGVYVQTDKYGVQHYDGTEAKVQGTTTVNDTWLFVAGRFDSDADRSIWINGSEEGDETTSQTTIGTIDKFLIGQRAWGGGGQFLDGSVSGIGCSIVALSDDDIAELYGGPEPTASVAPVMSGTPTQGQTLSCTQGTWGMPSLWSGKSNGTITYAYQWLRSDDNMGTNETEILDGTSSTYTLRHTDIGKYIRCHVRASNDGGYASEEGLTSYTATAVATINATPGSLSFPQDGYVNVGSLTSADRLSLANSNGSILFWVKPDNSAYDVAPRIIAKETGGSGAGGYSVWYYPDTTTQKNYLGLGLNGTAYNTNYANVNLVPYVWQPVAITWDGANAKFYIWGELAYTATALLKPPTTTATLHIGQSNGVASRRLNGNLRDLSVHDDALTVTEIRNWIKTGLVTTDHLVANWRFDDGSGTTPIDSAHGWDGAFASSSTDPSWDTDFPEHLDQIENYA